MVEDHMAHECGEFDFPGRGARDSLGAMLPIRRRGRTHAGYNGHPCNDRTQEGRQTQKNQDHLHVVIIDSI